MKTLTGLGLTRLDAQVYIYLAKKGLQKGQDLSKGLKVQKQQLYHSLKTLQIKGIVTATLEHPSRFNAVSFDKVVDIFVKVKMAEAQRIQEESKEILANWQAISIDDSIDATSKFNVIEDRGPIYAKILQMMNETKTQLSTISTVTGLVRADQFGLFDAGIEKQLRPKMKFRAITELSEQNLQVTKNLLREITKSGVRFEGKTPDLALNLPQMVIRDEEEILFFITPKDSASSRDQEACLWTNCKSLVQAFTAVFEDLWRNSTDINVKIAEIETGKPAAKAQIIEDGEIASKKFGDVLRSASKEVVMLTSERGLLETCKNKLLLSHWARNGVNIRIMAPLSRENIGAAQQLSRQFEVKHIPIGYLDTVIVDREHFFQFNAPSKKEDTSSKSFFRNTFYTNDPEHVSKTGNMLSGIWANSYPLSKSVFEPAAIPDEAVNKSHPKDPLSVTAERVDGPKVVDNDQTSAITERDVLDRFMSPPKYQNKKQRVVYSYGSNAQAIIRPPSHLNLTDLLLHMFHNEKHSTFGNEDFMLIHLWLKTPAGYTFVPAAFVTDNASAVDFWKEFLAGLPAGKNIQVVEKDEFQIRASSNSFFAAWTRYFSVPPYTLPPSCVLVESIGEIKAGSRTIVAPSGYISNSYHNSSEAFITFFHPLSKYSGPGTDGVFSREVVMEHNPPESN